GHPMIPNAKRETSGRIAVFDVGRGNRRDRPEYRRSEKAAARGARPREGRMSHRVPPTQSPVFSFGYFLFCEAYPHRRNPARGRNSKRARVCVVLFFPLVPAKAGTQSLIRD